MHHELRVYPRYFEAVLCGDKRFEIRNNCDKDFQRGDTFTLYEGRWGNMTGRMLNGTITFVTAFQQQPNYVVFGFTIDTLT